MESAFDPVERKIPPVLWWDGMAAMSEPVSGMDIYRDPFCKDFHSFRILVLAGTGQ